MPRLPMDLRLAVLAGVTAVAAGCSSSHVRVRVGEGKSASYTLVDDDSDAEEMRVSADGAPVAVTSGSGRGKAIRRLVIGPQRQGPSLVFVSARLRSGFEPRKLAIREALAGVEGPAAVWIHDEEDVEVVAPGALDAVEAGGGNAGDLTRALFAGLVGGLPAGSRLVVFSDVDLRAREPLPDYLQECLERRGLEVVLVDGSGRSDAALFVSVARSGRRSSTCASPSEAVERLGLKRPGRRD